MAEAGQRLLGKQAMSSPSFTCISCRVAFASADLQRAHYKSDWHRYNLKRKVAEMVPVTAEEFKQRVLDKQAQSSVVQKDSSSSCKTCGKHFSTENAFTNHMQSKKHKEAEARIARQQQEEVEKRNSKNREKGLDTEPALEKQDVTENNPASKEETATKMKTSGKNNQPGAGAAGSSQDVEMVDDDDEWEDIEGDSIAITDCLFCSHSSQTLEKNCNHMTLAHSFFLPNVEYICDLDGLLAYLGEKVGCGFMCLWCNDRGRNFFSLDAVQRHMRDKGHCKLQYEGDVIYEYAEYYDFRQSYPDHADPARRGETQGDSDDEELDDSSLQVHQEGYELVLPSGARVGHRELQRYFRQNVPPTRQIVKKNSAVIGRIMTQYKALGWSGDKGEAAQKRVRDMRHVQKIRSRKDLHLRLKANKMQPYLRPQVIF